jgi:hypothetical protein
MEEPMPSTESKLRSLAEIHFRSGPGPVPHAVRFYDPRDVAAHFAALEVKAPSAEERWAKKCQAIPFPGL